MINETPRDQETDLLRLQGIVKAFPGVVANDDIDFDLRRGEIHALLGENGSGKSTLMKIAYGIYRPDRGRIFVDGEEVLVPDPQAAVAHGIGMVHQHFMLVPSLTVLENLALGFEERRGPILDRSALRRRVEPLFDNVGLSRVPLDAPVARLTVGEQQRVEIIKALLRGASILILDEPTAVLTPQEVRGLGRMLLRLREEGYGLVLITHKLDEVFEFSDRVTVLRQGKRVASRATGETDKRELARSMVGREVEEVAADHRQAGVAEVVAAEQVTVRGDSGGAELSDATLRLHEGEIVGIAGVSGNGQTALAEVVAGVRKVTSGRILFKGEIVEPWTRVAAIRRGVAYVPEDRQTSGLVSHFSVEENLIIKSSSEPPFSKHGLLRWRAIRQHANDRIARFDIRPPRAATPVRALSGGNQQKAILARELSGDTSMVVVAEPTRGLDVGAMKAIHKILLEQRAEGKSILLISSDLDEILALADRIAVMYGGRLSEAFPFAEVSRERLGLLMTGVTR